MPYNNIPGTKFYKEDGNNAPEAAAAAPRVCVVGVSGKGRAYEGFVVSTTSLAKAEFGTEGTLLRGMWEAKKGGANEILLYRVGCTAASVTGIGDTAGTAGYTVSTIEQKPTAGDEFSLYYDDTLNRLVIYRVSDSVVVYDNDPGNEVDLYQIIVSGGRAVAGGADIGSPSSSVVLSDIDTTGTTYTVGTDGLSLSKMELYEKLYIAYKGLLQESFDVIVPMNVFLDDSNIVDQGHFIGAIAPVIPGGQTYPTAGAYTLGTDVDSLGMAHVERYYGEYYFWWRTTTGTFTAAEVYPSVGSADATHKIDGTELTADDFHEVNFGYQLGRFLYDFATDIVDATGVIGVLPPASNSITSKAQWVGEAPSWTIDTSTGLYTIASSGDNGYGLLGNKFMVGRNDHRSGVFGGGMILTDTEFMDGEEQVDNNEIPVDLGKYVSVFSDTLLLRNNWLPTGYLSTGAAGYAGFYLELNPSSAPTNKVVPTGMDRVFKFSLEDINSLVGAGYVVTRRKPQGLVFVDAPMATMPNSDWKRLSTVRIVKDIIDGVRTAAEPYIGEGFSNAAKESLKTDIESVLTASKQARYLKDYKEFDIVQTPSMAVAGTASITLRLVPAYELRVLTVTVAVQKS